ncbi:hypothetical protein U0A98_21800 [Escherichia coli]|nr:hypothetical protein [Escherichia coli]MDY9818325.1 hypothetical protein [Escherichia coli]
MKSMKELAQAVIDNCSCKITLPINEQSKQGIKNNSVGVKTNHVNPKNTLPVIDVIKF